MKWDKNKILFNWVHHLSLESDFLTEKKDIITVGRDSKSGRFFRR